MASMKWIRLKLGMFDDDKIKVIQAMPEGDSLLVIWIRLLILAGVSNADGYLMISENLPYTEEMLATIFAKPLSVIRLALKTFETFGMLENNRDGIFIPDFMNEQSEKMSDIREYNRQKKAESRERAKQKRLEMSMTEGAESQKVCHRQVNDMSLTESMTCQPCQTTDIDIDKDIIINNNNIPQNLPETRGLVEKLDYDRIVNLYNSTCKDLPKVRGLSDDRRRKIRALLNNLDKSKVLVNIEPYERLRYIFQLADESDFLSGRECANNWCGFDWLINAKNALKVIEGNYKNKGGAAAHGTDRTGLQQTEPGHTEEPENEALAIFRASRQCDLADKA